MNHSFFDLTGEENPAYAKGYYFRDNEVHPFHLGIPGGNGAGGALVSTANDMSSFLQHLLNDWKKVKGEWLPEHYLTEMETVHSTLAAKHGLQTGFGLGNELFPNNNKVSFRGHSGSGDGFNSRVSYNREAGVGFAICINGNTGTWPIAMLIEKYLTKNLNEPKLQNSKESLSRFIPLCGYYQFTNPPSEMFGFVQKVFDGLTLSVVDDKRLYM